MTPAVEEWLARILSQDAMTFEDAYWGTRPDVALVVPRLLELLAITPEAFTRGKLIELLGESGDAAVAPVLAQELQHADETVRTWAQLSLDELAANGAWQRSEAEGG